MLGISSYEKSYVDYVRGRMAAQVAAYESLAAASGDGDAVASFEPQCFTHLVMTLDDYFGHRLRGKELKDGNPLNEVRMICTSMIENEGVLAADKTIKYKAEASALGLEIGDEIAVDKDGFVRLCRGFLAEIEVKYA